MIALVTNGKLQQSKFNRKKIGRRKSSFFIWHNNCPGIRRRRPKHMTARAFTNVHKHFSLRVRQACACSGSGSTTCRRCQILRELQNELQLQISRSCKFCEGAAICQIFSSCKRSYDGACQILIKELRLWQLRLRLSIFMQLRIRLRAVKFL